MGSPPPLKKNLTRNKKIKITINTTTEYFPNPENPITSAKNNTKINKKKHHTLCPSDNSMTGQSPPQCSTSVKIFNLSKYVLNPYECSLLEKGLTFCPTSKHNDFQLFIDLNTFIRKLTLTRHFSINNSTSS